MVESFAQAGWPIPSPSASMFAWAPVSGALREPEQPRIFEPADRKGDPSRSAPGVALANMEKASCASRWSRTSTHPTGRAPICGVLRQRRPSVAQCRAKGDARLMFRQRLSVPGRPHGAAAIYKFLMRDAVFAHWISGALRHGSGPGKTGAAVMSDLVFVGLGVYFSVVIVAYARLLRRQNDRSRAMLEPLVD